MNDINWKIKLPCHASNLRGKLKHIYLTNKVCLKTLPDDLLDSMLHKEDEKNRHQTIRNLIAELLETMGSAEDGFSPAQLIDQLEPFKKFPAESCNKIKEQVHEKFLRDFDLEIRRDKLKQISDEFITVLDIFLAQSSANESRKKDNMQVVQEKARALIRELENLPKGIWLWKPAKGR